jgi:hypothetical protein
MQILVHLGTCPVPLQELSLARIMPWLLCRRRLFTLGAIGLGATANSKAHRTVTSA